MGSSTSASEAPLTPATDGDMLALRPAAAYNATVARQARAAIRSKVPTAAVSTAAGLNGKQVRDEG